MKKKILLFILTLTLLMGAVTANASDIISGGISELSLAAQRYYNTKVAYENMTITRLTEDKYEIYHYNHHNGKALTAHLYLTEWGTWNLGSWNITYNGVTKTVIGGSTDWEYVFRIINPISHNLEFTGGNHGSETLNSIAMYDDVTGEVFELNVGESKYVNRLVVKEKTTILQTNISYLPYANVLRTYTFTGDTINLDCDIEFIRDVKMALSYSAMACVNKDFGSNCVFEDGTNVITAGKGFCSNKHLGNVAAMSCTMSGADDAATVTIGIYNKKDMTDNFSNDDKTFVWDMSENYNKLYFSRGNLTETTVVKSGTVWNFGSYWKVNW